MERVLHSLTEQRSPPPSSARSVAASLSGFPLVYFLLDGPKANSAVKKGGWFVGKNIQMKRLNGSLSPCSWRMEWRYPRSYQSNLSLVRAFVFPG